MPMTRTRLLFFWLFAVACQDYRSSQPTAAPPTIVINEQKEAVAADANGIALGGNELYAKYCERCHNPIATTDIPGVDAAAITLALGSVEVMSALQKLQITEINAIAGVLSKLANPAAPVVDDDGDDDDDDEEDDDDDDDD